ncbi:MAG: GNAT family N-acetyltransferase [Hyphomicrobiaceae bacterium]|nr:MAG: GNAT family N-acetyltransferase [Hyphomicrobiaceae bacterium]
MASTQKVALRRARADERRAIEALQRAAYARNRTLLGVEPLPLLVDYGEILRTMETWVADGASGIEGVLILEPHPDHMLIWSIASDPSAQSKGLGGALLAAAEDRARALGLNEMRLYTGTVLTHLVDWYRRHGYSVSQIEQLPDRSVTHMTKLLP